MADVAILGAGELGGSIAHVLARCDIVSSIHLIDDAGRVAEGKALDITQSAPIEPFATRVTGSRQFSNAAGAELIFVADRVNGGEWQDDAGLLLLEQLARSGSRGVIVCAGASQRLMIERGIRELRIARNRLLGSAPEALSSAIRAVTAAEAGRSPRDINLTVLGVPPSAIVVPWEKASMAGLSLASVLDQSARRRLSAKVAPLWPPGPHGLAAAAATIADGILGGSRRTVSVFVGPDDSSGRRARAAALPVRLGSTGIVTVEPLELNAHERVALENAMLL